MNILSTLLSLLTICGIFLHDTTSMASIINVPASLTNNDSNNPLKGNPHNHVERVNPNTSIRPIANLPHSKDEDNSSQDI